MHVDAGSPSGARDCMRRMWSVVNPGSRRYLVIGLCRGKETLQPAPALLHSLLLCSCVFLGAALASPALGAGSAVSASEVEASVRKLAVRRLNGAAQRDRELREVASWVASQALVGGSDRATVRDRLWRQGVRDFEFQPVTVVGSGDSLVAAITPLLADSAVDWKRYNRFAVAVATAGSRWSVSLVATRRVGVLRPTSDGEQLVLRLPEGYSRPRVYATLPSGDVVERPAHLRGPGAWTLEAGADPIAGTSLLELLADGSRGPEVLAIWQSLGGQLKQVSGAPTPRLGTSPAGSSSLDASVADEERRTPREGRPLAANPYRQPSSSAGLSTAQTGETDQGDVRRIQALADGAAWVVGAAPGPLRSPQPEDAAAAEEHLWRLVQATRKSRGLLPLRKVAELVRAARRHAGDISRGEPFGHVTSSGTAMERLHREGVTVLRAQENVAIAADVAQVHAALMASPAHRANILDPDVSSGGFGVVLRRDASGRWSAVASELFAVVLADGDGDQWAGMVLNRINDRRRSEGLGPLRRRGRLDEVAREASAMLIEVGSTEFAPDQRRAIAEKARFHFLNVHRVGVDLLITTDPTAVDQVAHSIDPGYREIGVGIVRLQQPLRDHAAGALIITLVFAER